MQGEVPLGCASVSGSTVMTNPRTRIRFNRSLRDMPWLDEVLKAESYMAAAGIGFQGGLQAIIDFLEPLIERAHGEADDEALYCYTLVMDRARVLLTDFERDHGAQGKDPLPDQ